MYSVGVVLLEVGLWRSLREINETLAVFVDLADDMDPNFDAEIFRGHLVEAAAQLIFYTGQNYADVVLRCLKDEATEGKSEEEIRILFLEEVVGRLKAIII